MTRAEDFQAYLADVAAELAHANQQADAFAMLADEIIACWARGGAVHVFGNGGSQANAAHAVLHLRDAGVRAHDVMAEAAWLTAQTNDHGYQTAGTEYLRTIARPGDAILAISGSGNSVNVVRALEFAGAIGLRRLGLLGFGGGRAVDLCDAALVLPSRVYGPVEDVHSVAIHALQRVIEPTCSPLDLRARV